METVAVVLDKLKNDDPIVDLTYNPRTAIYDIKFNNISGKLGIPDVIYNKIWLLLQSTNEIEDKKASINRLLIMEYYPPFLSWLNAYTSVEKLPMIGLSVILQNFLDFKTFNAKGYLMNKNVDEVDVRQFLYNVEWKRNNQSILINSGRKVLQVYPNNPLSIPLTYKYIQKLSWPSFKTKEVFTTNLFYLNHIYDHYDVEHYHVAYTVEEVEYILADALKRTWIAYYDWISNRLSPSARIAYGFRLVHPEPYFNVTEKMKTCQMLHAYPPLYPETVLRRMTPEELAILVVDKIDVSKITNIILNSIIVRSEQLEIMDSRGEKPIPGRFTEINLPTQTPLPEGNTTPKLILQYIPNGHAISQTQLLKYEVFDSNPRDRVLACLFPLLQPAIPYGIVDPTRLTLTSDSYRKHGLPKYIHNQVKMSCDPELLKKYYFDDGIILNLDDDVLRECLLSYLTKGASSPKISISPEDKTIKFSGLSALLTEDVTNVFNSGLLPIEVGISRLLSYLLPRILGSQTINDVTIINSPANLSTLNSVWKQLIRFSYRSIGESYYGTQTPISNIMTSISSNGTLVFFDMLIYKFTEIISIISDLLRSYTKSGFLYVELFGLSLGVNFFTLLGEKLTELNLPSSVTTYWGFMSELGYQSIGILWALDKNGVPLGPDVQNVSELSSEYKTLLTHLCGNDVSLEIKRKVRNINFNLNNIDEITPGDVFKVLVKAEFASEASSILSNLTEYLTVQKHHQSDIVYYSFSGIHDRLSSSILTRRGGLRKLENSIAFSNLEVTKYNQITIRNLISSEQLLTNTCHEVILNIRQQTNRFDNALTDFGAGRYRGIHLTNGQYTAIDAREIEDIEVPNVLTVTLFVDYTEPIPVGAGNDVLIFNSLFLSSEIPTTDLEIDGFTTWFTDFFAPVFANRTHAYFNLPIGSQDLLDSTKSKVNLRFDGEIYWLKLHTYPEIKCFNPAVLQTIRQIATTNNYSFQLISPTMLDLEVTIDNLNLSANGGIINEARALALVLPMIILMPN